MNEQIDSAFRIALGREPSVGEAQRSSDFIMGMESEWKEEVNPRNKALADFCHTLINSAAFLYID